MNTVTPLDRVAAARRFSVISSDHYSPPDDTSVHRLADPRVPPAQRDPVEPTAPTTLADLKRLLMTMQRFNLVWESAGRPAPSIAAFGALADRHHLSYAICAASASLMRQYDWPVPFGRRAISKVEQRIARFAIEDRP